MGHNGSRDSSSKTPSVLSNIESSSWITMTSEIVFVNIEWKAELTTIHRIIRLAAFWSAECINFNHFYLLFRAHDTEVTKKKREAHYIDAHEISNRSLQSVLYNQMTPFTRHTAFHDHGDCSFWQNVKGNFVWRVNRWSCLMYFRYHSIDSKETSSWFWKYIPDVPIIRYHKHKLSI